MAMPAILYLYDGAALWRRIGAFFTGASCLLFLAGIVLSDETRTEPTTNGVAFVLLVLVVTAADVLIVLNVRQGTTDGLRLDAAGLTKDGGGREKFWAWGEMSGIRLHSRFHPASLLVGRCVSFRTDGDSRQATALSLLNRLLFLGQTVVIGDNFFVLSRELADRLTEYRDSANAGARRSGRSAPELPPPPPPALFIQASALNNRKRLRMLFMVAVALLFAGVVLGAGFLFAERTWPEALDILLDSGLAFYMALPILLVPAIGVSLGLWATSPVSNLMLIAAGGLHVRRAQKKMHWTWDEIFETSLNHYPSEVPTKRTEWTIGLTAAHAGTRSNKPPKDDKPQPAIISSLEDIYELPLEEVVAKLWAWTDWRDGPAPPATGSPRPAIRFHQSQIQPSDAIRGFSGGVHLAAISVAFISLLVGMRFIKDVPGIAFLLMFGPILIVSIAQLPLLAALTADKWNYLELGERGLTWRRVGRKRHWTWLELPSFELRMVKLRWKRKPTAVILFAGHRDDKLSRFLRWAYEIDEALPRIVIEDIYDSPIQEILSKLKEYRQPSWSGRVLARRPRAASSHSSASSVGWVNDERGI